MPERCAKLSLLLALVLSAGACAAPAEQPEFVYVEVPFLTNRATKVNGAGALRFTTDIAATTGGRCELSVYEMPDAEVVVDRYRALPVNEALDLLAPGDSQRVTMYVHGYNIGLERACRDAAVLARRTGFEGRTVLFSWPASRTIVTYRKDERRFADSMPQIVAALDELGRRHGRQNVNIVTHSMGSRIVLEAIESLDMGDEKFGDLVLIAPDIDREAFVEVLPDLKRIVEDITVLVSDDDRLLLLSQTVNLGARLGQSGGEIDGVDIIDVTEVDDAGFGGHVYHLTDENVGRVIGGILDGKAGSPASIDSAP